MDWCVKSPTEANHPPVVGLLGFETKQIGNPIGLVVDAGKRQELSATGSSDPDGDKLAYHWFVYKEAGDYVGDVKIDAADKKETELLVPADAKEKRSTSSWR